MLVPAMSLQEIRAEVESDFHIVHRKASYVGEKLYKKYKPRSNEMIEQIYDYTSKQKNTWLYKVMVSKRTSEIRFLVYFYSARELVAIQPCNTDRHPQLIYITAHFINRYNERLHLNFVKPYDIIRAILDGNHQFNWEPLEELRAGVERVFCVMHKGIGLSVLDKKNDWLRMNTFLSNDMLKGSQQDRYAIIRLGFEEEE